MSGSRQWPSIGRQPITILRGNGKMPPAFVLDTDTFTLLRQGHPEVCRRVALHPQDELALTVITVEEQLSGWYSLLRKAKRPEHVALAYEQLAAAPHALA